MVSDLGRSWHGNIRYDYGPSIRLSLDLYKPSANIR